MRVYHRVALSANQNLIDSDRSQCDNRDDLRPPAAGKLFLTTKTMSQSRPFGISLIASLLLVEAIIAVGIAALVLLNPNGGAWFFALLQRTNLPVAMSSLLAIPPLLTATVAGLTFRGLWEQREWARIAAIILTFLLSASAVIVIAFLFAFDSRFTSAHITAIIALIASIVAFLYLLTVRFDKPPSAVVKKQQPSSASGKPPEANQAPTTPPLTPPHPDSYSATPSLIPPPPRQRSASQAALAATTVAAVSVDNTQVIQDSTRKTGTRREPVAWLVVRQGPEQGQVFQLFADKHLTLGRNPAHTYPPLTDPTVSGSHAEVRYEQGRCVIYDLDSTNGTFIGDSAVQRFPLLDGDEVRLGSTVLLFTTSQP